MVPQLSLRVRSGRWTLAYLFATSRATIPVRSIGFFRQQIWWGSTLGASANADARRAWTLRHNFTFYDALYVALASHLDIPLLTADPRLRREPGLTCHTEFV